MGVFRLRTTESMRSVLTKSQQKQIQALYKRVAKRVAQEAKHAPRVSSDYLRRQYLLELEKQLQEALEDISKELEKGIKSSMRKVIRSAIEENKQWLSAIGMPSGGAFSHVPDRIIRSLVTGQLYEGEWSLSGAIWGVKKKTQEDIGVVIAEGIAQNKSTYDIAKDLEKYINPVARKPWDWSKVYPGTAKKVDYNAQRLARTMVSHAYQQAFVHTTQHNPFFVKYRWDASNSTRTCELCKERDGKLYDKDDLPLDHPNGMCTYEAILEGSMLDVADRIAAWYNGSEDPELDTWAKDTYGE